MDDRHDVVAHDLDHEADATTWRTELSEQVRRLTEVALGQALDAVTAGPMAPFVLLDRAGGLILGRFDGERSTALARARAHARASGASRAAVAGDGRLLIVGVRQEAVVVEASDRGRPGVVVAHRYRETEDGTVVVGRPVLVGPGDAVL